MIALCDTGPLVAFLNRNDPHHGWARHVDFDLSRHWPRVRTLMRRYARMDLADATLVVMAELFRRSRVLTIDRKDFSTYRRNDRQVIDFVAPPVRRR